GSLSDITLVTAKKTTPEEVNAILLEESQTPRYSKVLLVSDEPLVSSDIIQSSYASIVDTGMTRVVDGDRVKVLVWYDNEWGFTNQMVREVLSLSITPAHNSGTYTQSRAQTPDSPGALNPGRSRTAAYRPGSWL